MSSLNITPDILTSLNHAESAYSLLNPIGAELSPNVGFETNTNGWVGYSGATLAQITTQSHSGSTSLQLTAGSNAFPNVSTSSHITVTAGTSYRFSVAAKAGSTARQIIAQFVFYNSSGTQIGSAVQPAAGTFTDSPSAWTVATITSGLTAPTGATSVLIQILINNAVSGETHFFDDISFAPYSANPVVTQSTLTSSLATKADLVSGVIPSSQLPSGMGGGTTTLKGLTDAIPLSNQPVTTSTIIGNSGGPILGSKQQLFGIWVNRQSWDDLNGARYLSANATYAAWIAANPTAAVDVGTALIPHGLAQSTWNTNLQAAAANTAVTMSNGTSTMLPSDIYYNMGAAMSDQTPANGTVYSRVWWEMNINPHASAIDRPSFIAAWNAAIPRYRQGFSDRATAMGRTGQNLQIVFCPLSDGQDYTTFWPDSANVDVVAMDIYATIYGSAEPTAAALTTSVGNYLSNIATFAASKGKPVAMGEWGNWTPGAADGSTGSRGRGDFPAYIDQVFDWAAAHNAVYMSYYNISALGPNVTMDTLPLSHQRYVARATAGNITYPATTDSTGKITEDQIPTRLSDASLRTEFQALGSAGTGKMCSLIYTNTTGQPVASYAINNGKGSPVYSTTRNNDDATIFSVNLGTADNTANAGTTSTALQGGWIKPLIPGLYHVQANVSFSVSAANQVISNIIDYGIFGTATPQVSVPVYMTPTANSGLGCQASAFIRVSQADITAGRYFFSHLNSITAFTVAGNATYGPKLEAVYLGA